MSSPLDLHGITASTGFYGISLETQTMLATGSGGTRYRGPQTAPGARQQATSAIAGNKAAIGGGLGRPVPTKDRAVTYALPPYHCSKEHW